MSDLGLNKADVADPQTIDKIEETVSKAAIEDLHIATARAYVKLHAHVFYAALHQECIQNHPTARSLLETALINTGYVLSDKTQGIAGSPPGYGSSATNWTYRLTTGDVLQLADAAVKLFQTRNPAYKITTANKRTSSNRLATISSAGSVSPLHYSMKDRSSGVERCMSANDICILYGCDELLFEVSIPFSAKQDEAGFKYLKVFRYIRQLTAKARAAGLPIEFEISLSPHDRFLIAERLATFWSISTSNLSLAELLALKNMDSEEGLYRISLRIYSQTIGNSEIALGTSGTARSNDSNSHYRAFKEAAQLYKARVQASEPPVYKKLRDRYLLILDNLQSELLSGMPNVVVDPTPLIEAKSCVVSTYDITANNLSFIPSEAGELALSMAGKESQADVVKQSLSRAMPGVRYNPAVVLYLDDLVKILESITRLVNYADPATTLLPEQ